MCWLPPNPCKSWAQPDVICGSARALVTVIVFRVCDSRFPFLWTVGGASRQRPARWHGTGEGPVQYFTDTPHGAWAELLRHEEITDPADLAGISTRLWAVHIGDVEMHEPNLTLAAVTSTPDGYEVCRAEARRLRAAAFKHECGTRQSMRRVFLFAHVLPRSILDDALAPWTRMSLHRSCRHPLRS